MPISIVTPGKRGQQFFMGVFWGQTHERLWDAQIQPYKIANETQSVTNITIIVFLVYFSAAPKDTWYFSWSPSSCIHVSKCEFSFQLLTTNILERKCFSICYHILSTREERPVALSLQWWYILCACFTYQKVTQHSCRMKMSRKAERQLWLLYKFFPHYKYRSSPIIATQSRSACGDKGEKNPHCLI